MIEIELKIEKSKDKMFWGIINYKDNLIVDSAPTVKLLKRNMKSLLFDFHGINKQSFIFKIITQDEY